MNRAKSLLGLVVGVVLGIGLVIGYLQLQGEARANPPAGSAANAGSSTSPGLVPGGGKGNLIAGEDALVKIYEEAGQSVVQITSSMAALPGSPFDQPVEGSGSGFVIDLEGHILTNNHVVAGVQEVEVTLPDGDTVPGKVVGRDAGSDLGIVQIEVAKDRLHPARLGNSDNLRVGQLAIAIGNPFRFERTMTSGIVSAVGRTFSDVGRNRPLRNLIQTDAAINPGNSGGPLLNSSGEVIGINTAIENPTGNRVFVGLGFAIPINTAKASLQSMLKGAQIDHPWLGVSARQITPTFAKDTGLPTDKGVYIIQVVPNSPASKAGLKGAFGADADLRGTPKVPAGGDIVSSIDGKALAKVEDLTTYLDTKQVGDVVTLSVVRGDGQRQEVKVTLEAWPTSKQG